MKLIFDPAVCDGFGFCAEMLPEMVALDEWGFPIVAGAEIPESLIRVARQVVKRCPRRALALTESVTPESSRHAGRSGIARLILEREVHSGRLARF